MARGLFALFFDLLFRGAVAIGSPLGLIWLVDALGGPPREDVMAILVSPVFLGGDRAARGYRLHDGPETSGRRWNG
jgi:hypothetical protein